jgi:hypothetical protein
MKTMKFQVERASQWVDDESPPCPEAERGQLQHVDRRTFRNEKEALRICPDWYKVGTEHGKRGKWTRLMSPSEVWFIEVKDLKALWAFVEREGRIVIGTSWADEETPKITIYDDYIE